MRCPGPVQVSELERWWLPSQLVSPKIMIRHRINAHDYGYDDIKPLIHNRKITLAYCRNIFPIKIDSGTVIYVGMCSRVRKTRDRDRVRSALKPSTSGRRCILYMCVCR